MNAITENIFRAKKVLGHIFTGKTLKQSSANPNYSSINRTIDDYASIKDALVHLVNCGFLTAKLPKGSDFLLLESSADEGGELYAMAITNKKPKIDDLEEGDIRLWNPHANTQNENGTENVNTPYVDLKADGSIHLHKGDSLIKMETNGDIMIKASTSEVHINHTGKVSIGNGTCEAISILHQMAQTLSTTTSTAPGAPISSAGDFTTIAAKLSTLKI